MKTEVFEAIGETLYSTVLESGLQLYVLPKPGYNKSFALFAAGYGGNDLSYQWNGQADTLPAGTAHFLEHKLFDTKDGSADQRLAAAGAIANAFTSPSMTAYYFECTGQLEENLKTLLQFVSEPYFTEESVAKEQGIIGQEIRMGDDSPSTQVYYRLMECLYANHPIKDRVIGTVESIRTLTPEKLYQCHKVFYSPGNMVLCVAGDVQPEQVEAWARETLHQAAEAPPVRAFGAPETKEPARKRWESEMEVSAPLFLLGFKGTGPTGDPLEEELKSELALELLCGASSPLYASLYEEGLIDKQFSYGYEQYPGCCYYALGGESRDPDRVAEAVEKERRRIAAEGIENARFERVKKASFGGRLRMLNSLEASCIQLAESHFQSVSYFAFPSYYEALSKNVIEAYIETVFDPALCAISIIRPILEKEPQK